VEADILGVESKNVEELDCLTKFPILQPRKIILPTR
jgi:hypothetical protein